MGGTEGDVWFLVAETRFAFANAGGFAQSTQVSFSGARDNFLHSHPQNQEKLKDE